jgi:hypothetical protein
MQIEEKFSQMFAYVYLAGFMLAGLVGCNIMPTYDTQQPLIDMERVQYSSATATTASARPARGSDFGNAPGAVAGFAAAR